MSDATLERFVVVTTDNNKYRVRDTLNGFDLRFGYNNPPLYGTANKPADVWNNYYSARGFCLKMGIRNDPR